MDKPSSSSYPRVTLTNGLVVANFSSPHDFTFVDGSVLPACDPEHSKKMMLDAAEIETDGIKGTTDINIRWHINSVVYRALVEACLEDGVDIVLVPLPVMTAFKEFSTRANGAWDQQAELIEQTIRCIRVADRITKTIHIDRFCK